LERFIAIERALPEYQNADITHNVEYSLHPSKELNEEVFDKEQLPVTSDKIIKSSEEIQKILKDDDGEGKPNQLLSKDLILRNSCVIGTAGDKFVVSVLKKMGAKKIEIANCLLNNKPFAIFECKRVGVEEGMKKGPQTIEKAKQGAYVAKTVSSLQKIRYIDGTMGGVIHKANGTLYHKEYNLLLNEVIMSDDKDLLKDFIMTVGIVSNHGNWFTSDSHNKELKVLAQSYDWLLFLTDEGLAAFISELLLKPSKEYAVIKKSFLASYSGESGKNEFTKVKINLYADLALQDFFVKNAKKIAGWFNVIAPKEETILGLRKKISVLTNKNWEEILK
jgi:hypothetical protein